MDERSGSQAVEWERRLREDRRLVDLWLRRALRVEHGVPRRLADAMRYALLGGGKRLRPILALEAFRACGGDRDEAVMPFCCGLEMIHAFSLVHDDLPCMDDDDMRRGRPSLHRRFDEATAVLAADGLLARGFGLMAECAGRAERVCRLVRMVAQAIGPAGMTGGQYADISERVAEHPGASAARRLARMQRLKTGELIAVSLVGGAVLAGAGKSLENTLAQAGYDIGALFQLTDDLIDEKSAPVADHTDAGERPTAAGRPQTAGMVVYLGRAGTLRRARRMADRAQRLLAGLGPRFAFLSGLPSRLLERTE